MKSYLIIIIVLLLSSCIYDPPDSVLKVINNADRTFNIILKVDTVPSLSRYGIPFYINSNLLSKDTLELSKPGANGWTQMMRGNKSNKLYLFIARQDSLGGRGSNESARDKQYKVISYTEKELDKLNWQITIK